MSNIFVQYEYMVIYIHTHAHKPYKFKKMMQSNSKHIQLTCIPSYLPLGQENILFSFSNFLKICCSHVTF